LTNKNYKKLGITNKLLQKILGKPKKNNVYYVIFT